MATRFETLRNEAIAAGSLSFLDVLDGSDDVNHSAASFLQLFGEACRVA